MVLLSVSVLVFSLGCYRRLGLIGQGTAEIRSGRIGSRIRNVIGHAFAQKKVIGKSFGYNHAVIFWSFVVLLAANVEFVVAGVFPGVSLALLPEPIDKLLLLTFDLASLLALIAVVRAIARRTFFPADSMSSAYVKARSLEGFLILLCIGVLMLAYFGMHGAMIATGMEPAAAYMPVSSLAARLLLASPLSLQPSAGFFWWLHAIALLAFICYLPQSKHMHILTAIPNIFFADLDRPVMLPREEFARGAEYGVASVGQFSWKDLLDGFSCTECGRCQEACPAAATGKSLNPRQVVHAIKTNLLANGSRTNSDEHDRMPLVGPEAEGTITAEAIWGCTTCGACMAACPTLIEHMPKIVKMRRHLVQMKSSFPSELLSLFENMEGRSNPWGIATGERTKWHATMDVRSFEPGQTEYLLYVGCAGAFDSRQKHVTVALATILNEAGVSWGILGKEERCCGDSLRRLGNEYVFDRMTRENVQLFKEKGVTKVITQCPHCFTTLKNDYRQYGLELEVVHHSELIANLIEDGRLRLTHPATGAGRIIYHDPCYLSRHNGITLPPRQALAAATGNAPAELGRNYENSFCCGAGGGRMWLEELEGSRINLNRVEEALACNPDTLCVSCPYCLTMISDGLKDLKADHVFVKDIAEVVAEGFK